MPERKHAGAPDAVLARPLSLASYPVATGRPRPGHQRPRARGGEKGLTRGPEINKSKSRRPEPVEQHRAAETILRRARFFGTHAPRDKENQPEKWKNAGEKARRSPRCCFGATPLVGELPRSNGQTTAWPSAPSRAWWRKRVNAGPPCSSLVYEESDSKERLRVSNWIVQRLYNYAVK